MASKKCIDVGNIVKDSICTQWIAYCTAEDNKQPVDWYKEKQTFWEVNQTHLEDNGFTYGTNMGTALDNVELMKETELEGSLLVVKIGNDSHPASPDDINLAHKMLCEVLEGVKGVRVVVTHHTFDITKISLPQLRNLQSAVLASTDPTDDVNPIIELDL